MEGLEPVVVGMSTILAATRDDLDSRGRIDTVNAHRVQIVYPLSRGLNET